MFESGFSGFDISVFLGVEGEPTQVNGDKRIYFAYLKKKTSFLCSDPLTTYLVIPVYT